MNLTCASIFILLSLFMIILVKIYLYQELLIIFMTLLFSNLMGLVPYSWGSTVFIWTNLLVSLICWFLYCMYKYINKMELMLSHFLPLMSPLVLWTFLIVLEITSQLIRPGTLSLRITCNLLAGHVVLSLAMNLNLLCIMILLMFEIFVSIIQAVVFSLLLLNYKIE